MSKIEIIPAILPKDFAELSDKIELIKGFTKTVQIDVCDGQFVPNATWPYRKKDDNFDRILREEEGLPGWEQLNYEFDLMVNRPENVVEEWVRVGATRIIIHAEAKGDIAAALVKLGGIVDIGFAFNIETPLDLLELHRERIQFVQCMGIDHIGYQHQPFDEKVLGKIKEVRLKYPGMPISVDGGVSLETAPHLIAAGADRLVVGSAIFNDENPLDALQKFKRLG
jgi:ribulose-phosphate 3-epimerase